MGVGAFHSKVPSTAAAFNFVPICGEVGEFFCIQCRGSFYKYRVLSVGWSFSPRIAQCVAWGLVLDNDNPALEQERHSALSILFPSSGLVEKVTEVTCI